MTTIEVIFLLTVCRELEKVHLSHHELAKILFDTINNLALDTIVDRGKDITPHLYRAVSTFIVTQLLLTALLITKPIN